MDPSEPFQGGTVAPLQHHHIKPVTDMFHQMIKQCSSGLGDQVKMLKKKKMLTKKKKKAFAV